MGRRGGQGNRGKRSVGIDLAHPEGRELLSRLVAEADVFVTNIRAGARTRLRIDVEDVRADNPAVVYARGTAFGDLAVAGAIAAALYPRFVDMDARRRNARACVEALEAVFAGRDLAEWRRVLTGFDGEWAVVQTPREAHDDPQVRANGYVADVDMANGGRIPLVTSPVQFDEQPGRPTRAPEHGEHTEVVLLDLGLSWDEIAALESRGAVL
jgi:crotonobetainyl-CoA:carnitine CoA-transferase CaiB-like acyl-CoA transferase